MNLHFATYKEIMKCPRGFPSNTVECFGNKHCKNFIRFHIHCLCLLSYRKICVGKYLSCRFRTESVGVDVVAEHRD